MTDTYETKVEDLKKIIGKIEDGTTGLDESIRLYERGAALVKECECLLAEAEVKISALSRDG